jgi:hypothetical protein
MVVRGVIPIIEKNNMEYNLKIFEVFRYPRTKIASITEDHQQTYMRPVRKILLVVFMGVKHELSL